MWPRTYIHAHILLLPLGWELTNIGASKCARDFVGPCQGCSRVVCRNCAVKPPAPSLLRFRHRRLCRICSSVDITTLIFPQSRNLQSDVLDSGNISTDTSSNSINMHICRCSSRTIWLCKICGRSIRNADQEYLSVWKWSTRILPSLGGLGIGLREADRGVSCGLGEKCCRAREVVLEIDCDAEDARENHIINKSDNQSNTRFEYKLRPGYNRHEIEGIGGVMKNKLVKMVKVGECVTGFEKDGKDDENILALEIQGELRSWCSWCEKVIPANDEYTKILKLIS